MPIPRLPFKSFVTGAIGKQRVSVTTKYDPANGKTVTTEWYEPGRTLDGYAKSLEATGASYTLTQTDLKSTLVETASDSIATGGTDDTTDRWEVLANQVQKDVKEHPRWVATSDAERRAKLLKDVNRVLEKGQASTHDWEDPDAPTDAKLRAFFNLLITGASHYATAEWVVRHTTNVWNGFPDNIADDGVLTVYTTASLISELSNSSLWTFPMPTRLQNKISGIAAPSPLAAGLTWGWLKMPSSESTGANNRIDISTEYWLSAWADILYV